MRSFGNIVPEPALATNSKLMVACVRPNSVASLLVLGGITRTAPGRGENAGGARAFIEFRATWQRSS
jgi:hypothetical protein